MNLIQALPSIAPLPGGGTIPLTFYPTNTGCFDLGGLILLVGAALGFAALLYLAVRTDKNEIPNSGQR